MVEREIGGPGRRANDAVAAHVHLHLIGHARRVARGDHVALAVAECGHIASYTQDSAQFRAGVRVTTAFLDRYLKGAPLGRLLTAGRP